jgi:lipopolysaccharide export system protein LptA
MSAKRPSRALLLAVLALTLGAFPAGGDTDTFRFESRRMETVLAKGRERTVLTGSAIVQTQDNVIRAERMELYGSDFQYVSCEGSVGVVNDSKGIEISCRKLFYDRKEKIVRVSGDVVMLDKKNEVVVKGGFLESWEDRDEAVVQIGVRILKKDIVCRAEFARYLRAEEKLELSGMPVVNWKGDEYRALKIYIDLKEDTIRLEGEVRGTVRSQGQEGAAAGSAGEPGEAPGETPATDSAAGEDSP